MDAEKSLNELRFAVRKVFEALGVGRCAGAMGCDEKTAYSYQNDQVIPTRRLLALLNLSRDTADPIAREQGQRIVSLFAAAAGCKAVSSALIDHVNRLAAAINNGGALRELGRGCPMCGGELTIRGYHDAEPVYGCLKCHGISQKR